MTLRPEEHVSQLLHGEQSLEAYAAEHGLDVAALRTWKSLYLAGGNAAFARKPTRRGVWLAVAVVAAALVPATVVAQANCTPAVPWPLKAFCGNQPAIASDINANFKTLGETLATRTGPLDGGVDLVLGPATVLRGTANADVTIAANAVWLRGQNGDGRALYTWNDRLGLNHGGAYQGTDVTGALAVSGALSASTITGSSFNGVALSQSGTDTNIGGSSLYVNGELRAERLRSRNCGWVEGNTVQLNAHTNAGCPDGKFQKGFSCQVPSGSYLQCRAWCCDP